MTTNKPAWKPPGKMHYRPGTDDIVTACGLRAAGLKSTRSDEGITCKTCLRWLTIEERVTNG